MSKKMKRFAEGEEVELETSAGPNKSITDDVRERAMRAIAAGGQKEEETPKPKKMAAPKPKKAERVIERNTEQENADESQRIFNKKPVDTTSRANPEKVRRAYIESAKYVGRPAGMKKGGMAKSASARADGCCIRGKTRA